MSYVNFIKSQYESCSDASSHASTANHLPAAVGGRRSEPARQQIGGEDWEKQGVLGTVFHQSAYSKHRYQCLLVPAELMLMTCSDKEEVVQTQLQASDGAQWEAAAQPANQRASCPGLC